MQPPANDRFCPDAPVTREQMAAFLTRAFDLPRAEGNTFTDDDGSVFEADIEALAAAGITRGCNPPANDRFCPREQVTRGQMAAFLHRALASRAPGGVTPAGEDPDGGGSDGSDSGGTDSGDGSGDGSGGDGSGGDGGSSEPAFTDIDGSPHAAAIEWLAARGITHGCNPPDNTRFCPGDDITRAQMASLLARALELPSGPDVFVDDDGSVHEADIEAIAAAGITHGCNPPANDRFCPDDSVTRAQMAAFLRRGFALPSGPDAFVDDDGHVLEGDIDALAAAGITRGCNPPDNDRFCPDRHLTRAQLATFLYRALTR